MTVDDYLSEISNRSSKFGSQLLRLLNRYNKIALKDITLEEAKEFYEELVRNNINDKKFGY